MNFKEPLLTNVRSDALEAEVEISVLFPPEFEGETLPLIINLHGGGDDRRGVRVGQTGRVRPVENVERRRERFGGRAAARTNEQWRAGSKN